MEALVLGGSRFIGLHLVRLLCEQGHEVTVLNRGQTPVALPDGVRTLTADRTEPAQVKSALEGTSYDVAFDISGYTPESLAPVVDALEATVGRFVFCSTTSVYAPSDTAPIVEDSPLFRGPDASQYARDKILCEDLLMDAVNDRGFPVTILRPPYVYGPDNYLHQREFSYFARLSQGRRIIVPGNGLNMVQAVHVDDLVDAFAAAPQVETTMGQTYTICGPDAITLDGWIAAIGRAMNVEPEIVHASTSQYLALPSDAQTFPYVWDDNLVYSNEKARRSIDWSPNYHMSDGLEMTYQWWSSQAMSSEVWDFSSEDRALEMLNES
ncbi:MAG: SDR family oxidoreductase [Chloroflexi bacterium]|nr:SDR family oxidoreductase [Chloroflexota bacterium]